LGGKLVKILVVGDSCKDVFVYGKVKRLSPEAPVPVFNPVKEKVNDGMAKNVLNNVEALDSTVYSITNKNNIRKIRYVDDKSNQLVVRVDEHDYCDRIDEVLLSTIQDNKCHIAMAGEIDVDAIIISDYDKGFLYEDDIKFICDNNKNVFVDTKKKLGTWINNVDFLKINDLEYEQNQDFFDDNDIFDKTIITKGNKGCLFQGKLYPTKNVPVKDISGAGDTFLAGLVVEYMRAKDIVKAIGFAQECTKIVVQKHGVSTV
jgi:D-beta-D-heptose 7-phosphate kinase/D-beta-D-heptose 1-phosphate adenosyltransferase